MEKSFKIYENAAKTFFRLLSPLLIILIINIIATIAIIKFHLFVLGQVFSKPKSKSNGKAVPLLIISAVHRPPWVSHGHQGR